MIFGQTVPYRRRATAFTADERQGASAAHADLLAAVLRYSAVSEACLYDLQGSPLSDDRQYAIDELRQRFPSKPVRMCGVQDLLTLSPDVNQILYEGGLYLTPVAQTRELSGGHFPICAVAHSVDILAMTCMSWTLPFLRPYDAILASSRAGATALQELFSTVRGFANAGQTSWGQPQIHEIPLGVDAEFLKALDRGTARHCLQISQDATVILYLGRFTAQQKADLTPLLVAIEELSAGCPELVLLLAGSDTDTAYSQRIEAEAIRRGIGRRLRIVKNFPYALKPLIYSASDVFVSPADNVQETFGLALVEAMACGLPVVASDWSGYRDIVAHGETGFLTPTLWNPSGADRVSLQAPLGNQSRYALPEQTIVDVRRLIEQLRTLIANPELRRTFGAAGRKRVESLFAWEQIIPRHEALWQELLAQSQAAGVAGRSQRLTDNYTQRFAHYATSLLSPEVRVRAGRAIDDWEAPRQTVQSFGIAMGAVQADSLRQACNGAGLSVGQLSHAGAPMETIAWMLKRGYLELCES